jgi:hypothetical protein
MNTMDSTYNLIEKDARAGIGLGHLPEAYANFGIMGIITVMSLQGFFFALFRRLYGDAASLASRAIYLLVMVMFMNGIGSYLAIHFGNLLQQIIVYTLVLQFMAGRLLPTGRTLPANVSLLNKQ